MTFTDTPDFFGHLAPDACRCFTCLDALDIPWRENPAHIVMVLCPVCGNKRCPHATDHRHACTSSNEPGQAGSRY